VRLPQRNALLTSITGKGLSEDWDDAATTGSVKWEGRADAYVQTDDRQVRDGTRDSEVITRTVVLPSKLPVEVGDTLGLTVDETPVSWPVVALTERLAPAGVPGTTLVEVTPG
jgi:hypothetical protein